MSLHDPELQLEPGDALYFFWIHAINLEQQIFRLV